MRQEGIMKERLVLKKADAAEAAEKKVTINVPESTYGLFASVLDHETIMKDTEEWSIFRKNMDQSLVINKEMYPLQDTWSDQGAPRGRYTHHVIEDSVFYPGIRHEYWLYVPAAYDENEPADLAYFYDAHDYVLDGKGQCYDYPPLAFFLDNLISKGEIPPTIAVISEPGTPGPGYPLFWSSDAPSNRCIEYDTTSDVNARYITEEILPLALEGLSVSADPADHIICGISSGGLASFSAAWFGGFFGRVYEASPSFANIRNGIVWPSVIRIADKKDLQVYTVVGRHDLDDAYGSWLLSALEVGAALHYRGYDQRFYVSEAGHSGQVLKYCMESAFKWLLAGTEPEKDDKLTEETFTRFDWWR